MKIFYDISVLGVGQYNPLARTGVARVIENIAYGLATSKECDLLFGESLSFQVLKACLDYQQSNPRLRGIPIVNSSFLTIFSSKLLELKSLLGIQTKINNEIDKTVNKKLLKNQLTDSLEVTQLILDQYYSSLYEVNLDKRDIFHANYYPIPNIAKEKRKLCKFLTVYDLIPILYPRFFGINNDSDHIVKQSLASLSTENDWAICISHSTKNDLCSYLKFDPARVFVTHLAAARDIFYPCDNAEKIALAQSKYKVYNIEYLLSLCTLEPRKNVEHLIRCFAQLVQDEKVKDLFLVLVGNPGWGYNKILEEISNQPLLKNRIILTGRVADEDLAALYSGALAFLYPSFYEGFGLPPLEAMQCGVPVITSNTSSLPEVVGDAGIMLDPTDSDGLCQSILEIYNKPSLREAMSLKSLEQAKKFSWEKCTQQTLAAYKTALSY